MSFDNFEDAYMPMAAHENGWIDGIPSILEKDLLNCMPRVFLILHAKNLY